MSAQTAAEAAMLIAITVTVFGLISLGQLRRLLARARRLVGENEATRARLRGLPRHTHEIALQQLHDVATSLCATCGDPVRVRWAEERVR